MQTGYLIDLGFLAARLLIDELEPLIMFRLEAISEGPNSKDIAIMMCFSIPSLYKNTPVDCPMREWMAKLVAPALPARFAKELSRCEGCPKEFIGDVSLLLSDPSIVDRQPIFAEQENLVKYYAEVLQKYWELGEGSLMKAMLELTREAKSK